MGGSICSGTSLLRHHSTASFTLLLHCCLLQVLQGLQRVSMCTLVLAKQVNACTILRRRQRCCCTAACCSAEEKALSLLALLVQKYKYGRVVHRFMASQRLLRPYLYFGNSKASKLSTMSASSATARSNPSSRSFWMFCENCSCRAVPSVSICTLVLVKQVN